MSSVQQWGRKESIIWPPHDSAIVYGSACEFVKQFYNPHRGDIVLNPLDARMPYCDPSKGLRRGLALPAGKSIQSVFCGGSAEDIRASFGLLPTPEDLVKWEYLKPRPVGASVLQ